ncbi:CcdC family protein [Aneurinibacillus migulanus]|nr:cytochrome c biogenesis protein CcdC [Aneurinibacillus migulanus]KIV51313.1 membrane protein [Aneurinibacillus migulanus]KON94785.1 membrane protein [Aneurinibacillus migulanus]MED0894673.1 cytochrome c biogenesis protein CcdC [Aneurinibacillus migulanus]MED1615161.1 cytochrome c biogenesis protein CcdC [Aneurinibacillus migulanus]MED4727925.1 cytochrome c biogenesis protein CcdC [Aneurinibacillus migulanus]
MTILSGVIGIFMATIVLMVRMRASKKPASLKKIILPPFFMSTGFAMFLYPPMHVHVTYALFAFFVGALLSYPLIVTSKFEVVGRDIYLKRSKAFFFILVGLVLLRLALKSYVGMYVSIEETAGLFFILAFGMIVPWRVAMYFEYVKLNRSLDLT